MGRCWPSPGFTRSCSGRRTAPSSLAGWSDCPNAIESLAFSPDGKKLAVTGGLPARMGEVQVWDVAKRKLALSVPVTYDTVYGVSWSPDGTKIAFGCTDNTVRAIDAKTGEQVLFSGSHNDWALDTVFSADGSHLISVGRDMAAKLTEVATQRFVDNITSITPGALKGGLSAVARHPKRDEIVIGGSDGEPKLYRVFRQTVRVIGDDSNLIREFPPLPGRVYSVAISSDGKRIAAGSSLDGKGEVSVYGYEFDTSLPAKIKAINEKVVTARSAEEAAELEKYHKEGVKQIANVKIPHGGIYAVAFRPDGKVLAAAGADGLVRLINPETGSLVKEFAPVDGQDVFGGSERTGHRRSAQAGRSGRDRGPSQGCEPGVAGSFAQGGPPEQSVCLCSASRDRQAGHGRNARRDPDGRAVALGGDRRGVALRADPAQGRRQGDLDPPPGRQDRDGAGDRTGSEYAGACRFRARRRAGACRGWAATRGPATARRRGRTASSCRSAVTTRSSTCGP